MRPPIKIECPDCRGEGVVYLGPNDSGARVCLKCNTKPETGRGTGEIYNYLTPEQWEAETGEKILDTDPVWQFIEEFSFLLTWGDVKELHEGCLIVARPGQPKPDGNYRPN